MPGPSKPPTAPIWDETALESFDNRPAAEEAVRRTRTNLALALLLVAGSFVVVTAVLFLAFPSELDLVGPGLLPIGIVILGVAVLALLLWHLAFANQVETVEVTESEVKLSYRKGRVVEFRWDDPALEGRVVHALREPSADAPEAGGWVLSVSGSGGRVIAGITPAAGDAVVARATLRGLRTSSVRREMSLSGGRQTLESTRFRHPQL